MMVSKFCFCPLCGHRLTKKIRPLDEHKRLACVSCGFVFFQNPVPTVIAIIEKDNKLLLTKRAIRPYKNCWTLPGGFVEVGQNLEETLEKEIKEELNVQVKKMVFFGSFVSSYQAVKIKEPICGTAFKVILKNENFKPGSDVAAVKWFRKDKLPHLVPFRDVRQAVKRLLNSSKNLIL